MIKKISSLVFLSMMCLYGNDNSYIKFGIQGVNDNIDIFNIKESENIIGNGDNFGDMIGFNFDLNYKFNKNFSMNLSYDQKRIDYLSDSIVNNTINLSYKNRFFSNESFNFNGIIGYETNRGKDLTISDIDTMNNLLDKFYIGETTEQGVTIQNAYIWEENDKYYIYLETEKDGVIDRFWPDPNNPDDPMGKLNVAPYGKFQNAKDDTFILGASLEPNINQLPLNLEFFSFFKLSKIEKSYITSLVEESDGVLTFMDDKGIDGRFDISRTDKILSLGFNTKYDFNDSFALKTKYEYIKIFRDDYLEETNDNHVVDVELNYNINPKFTAYIGGTIMSNQFNGVIPYFYDEYTKTTFDHKYGWAEIGLKYKF